MATVTAQNLLDQYLADRGITLSPVQYNISLGRLQKAFTDAGGSPTNLAISLALLKNQDVKEDAEANTPLGGNPALVVAGSVQETIEEIEAEDPGPTDPTDPTEPVEPVVDHYELRAAKAEANEGEANTFTVVAVDVDGNEVAVKEAVSVVFELKIAAGDTASLADFNAGAFNPVHLAIDAGQSVSAPFSVEPISNDGTETTETYTVTATVAGETLTVNAKILDGSAGAGQTFVLTTGVDLIPGMNGSNGNAVNSGNDLIVGVVGTGVTLQGTDMIDGGDGTDTIRIISDKAAAITELNVVSNVEIVEVRSASAGAASIDTTNREGVTNLNITSATDTTSFTATAATTTDVTVSGGATDLIIEGGKNITVTDATATTDITIGATIVNAGTITVTDTKLGTGAITIDGGTDVTVTASGVTTGTLDIGQKAGTTADPSGAVVVKSTGAAFVAATSVTLGAIKVDGGKTISVTQVATSDASKAAADKTGGTITQSAVTIKAGTTTTDVTVKQDAAVGATLAADSTGGATTSDSIKFGALAATKTVVLGGLTLTATVDMTAAEVAAAFANLAAGAAKPGAANGDTQSAAAVTKATYTGSINGWTSGAANGDTVVFTSTTANGTAAAITDSGSGGATTITSVATGKAHDATPVGGVMGISNGVVDITGAAALKTVTVDGYAAGASANKVQGVTNTALDTITLANGGNMTIDSAAATLALNLTNVNGTVDVQTGTKTLNVDVSGTGTAVLKSSSGAGSIKALSVSGSGNVSGTANTGNLGAVNSISTAAMTAGEATFTIDSTATSYTGGAGKDIVTFGNTTAADKAIDLGAGDDTLVFAAGSAVPTVTLKGGAGDDTVSLAAADAVTLSGSTAFAAQLDSFERLEVTGATGTQAIDLGKLGFTNHVTVAGAGTLTLTDLANNGTVVITAAPTTGYTIGVKDAATGTADVVNVKITSAGAVNAGVLTVANVETINIESDDTDTTAHANSLTLTADKATTLNVTGDAGLTLTALTGSTKLATIDASTSTGVLTASATGDVAMTIKGGAGNDVLSASSGANAKADVINGGDGNDTITAGSNGAKLTGGAGNDIFVLASAAAATGGNKEANTYSTIEDFSAGDLLQLAYNDGAAKVVTSFAKLGAALDAGTAVFSDYVNAAMVQAAATTAGTAGDAVWFSFGGSSYVVVDSGTETTGVFTGDEDLIIKLAGVDLTNASWNATFGTVSL